MTADLYDVIIVGAGPSGSTAGYYLGKNPDIRVLIVDRFEFPRYKSCAGGLFLCDDWPREFENFNSGLEMVSRQPCYDCDFYFDRKFIHRTYNTHLFDVVDRAEFDAALLEVALQQSNVKFKRFPVERIRYESGNGKDIYCLESADNKLFSRYIIGADGFRGVVSRFLGNKIPKSQEYGRCLQYNVICEKLSNPAVSVFFNWDKEVGFSWVFPNSNGYYVGLGFIGKTKRPLLKHLDQFLEFTIEKELIPVHFTNKRLSGAPCPVSVVPRFCYDRILLCGDSLGAVRQLTGEGIYYAMKTGKIAALCILEGNHSLSERYKKALKPVFKQITILKRFPPVAVCKLLIKPFVAFFSWRFPFGIYHILRKWLINTFHRMYFLPSDSLYKPL